MSSEYGQGRSGHNEARRTIAYEKEISSTLKLQDELEGVSNKIVEQMEQNKALERLGKADERQKRRREKRFIDKKFHL